MPVSKLNAEEVLKVFAQSEEEQAVYFPEYNHTVFADIGIFEVETRSSRFVALCALAHFSKGGEVYEGDLGQRFIEIAAISNLVIQVSGVYEWLVWHPKAVSGNSEGIVDPTIFEVWSIIRRLSKELLQLLTRETKPKSYHDLFSEILR
jgi:hypothetical protein